MIDGSAVKEIAGLATAAAEPQVLEIEGRTYVDKDLKLIRDPKVPEPATLVVHTLTGLVDYIAANKDAIDLNDCVVHVVAPDQVDLLSRTQGHHLQRFTFITAKNWNRFEAVRFSFGSYLDTETMIIGLLALFADTPHRAEILRVIGNLSDDQSIGTQDDGVTQRATVKVGITLRDNATLPNPVSLSPNRTFPEIEQPVSPFVFRMKSGGGAGITTALFEADGGAWKNTAIASISDWLSERLPEINGGDGIAILA